MCLRQLGHLKNRRSCRRHISQRTTSEWHKNDCIIIPLMPFWLSLTLVPPLMLPTCRYIYIYSFTKCFALSQYFFLLDLSRSRTSKHIPWCSRVETLFFFSSCSATATIVRVLQLQPSFVFCNCNHRSCSATATIAKRRKKSVSTLEHQGICLEVLNLDKSRRKKYWPKAKHSVKLYIYIYIYI